MSIFSMTGFGRATVTIDALYASVEICSVNRKQAEVVVSLPRDLTTLELKIKQYVLEVASRGRIQVTVTLSRNDQISSPLKLNHILANALETSFAELSTELKRDIFPVAGDFLRVPGMLLMEESTVDIEKSWLVIEPALIEATRIFQKSRSHEGENLAADLMQRLAAMETFISQIQELAPGRALKQKDLLLKRLVDLHCPIDPSEDRIVKEISLFADRCDISEEITRLNSHFEKFRNYMKGSEPAGRALDFLCQEIHRECNTIGSKANDSAISHHVVAAKTELEKIREQVQNLE
jgi:uncharacterized protein (TIGR00255 family)